MICNPGAANMRRDAAGEKAMSDRWAVLQLQMNDLDLTMLPGIGGRLWDVTFQGRSLLFQNPDLDGLPIDEANLAGLPTRSPQFGFPLWGGEKTWIAPDTSWTDGAPYPALDSGAYQVASSSDDHVEMTSPVCPICHLAVTRRITLKTANSWTIDHAVTNHGHSPRLTGIWSVMMIDAPARIGVAMENPTIHPVFGSAGPLVSRYRGCVVANCSRKQEFKVGLPNPGGETLIGFDKGELWMMCSVPKAEQGDRYAHRHPVEVFNSGDYAYCEAEWHSPAVKLMRGDTLNFQQEFRIWTDEDPSDAPESIITHEEFQSCMS
ncbi:hypothetical protein [Notoacmeibacter marinus]|nr:hypothetical protein [Notoacmeibacter marinus]